MWKWVIVVAIAVVIGIAVLFYFKAQASKQGASAGLSAGKLTLCPNKPNCVCSEFANDRDHYLEPITLTGTPETVMPKLQEALTAMGGKVVKVEGNYLAATFTSKLFGFIDDVELRFDPTTNQVQFRSASRQGHSDLGVNKKRMQALKAQLARLKFS